MAKNLAAMETEAEKENKFVKKPVLKLAFLIIKK